MIFTLNGIGTLVNNEGKIRWTGNDRMIFFPQLGTYQYPLDGLDDPILIDGVASVLNNRGKIRWFSDRRMFYPQAGNYVPLTDSTERVFTYFF